MPYTAPLPDFYGLLQIPRDATPGDIKTAYHHTLLRLHPDKRSQRILTGATANANGITDPPPEELSGSESVDVALLKEAYRTLSDPSLRAVYDGSLGREEHARPCGPRPAQVVSLEEFTTAGTVATESGIAEAWWHGCRCGGTYRITQDDLENGTHLVGCESCSEVIWVGYEEAPMTEGE